MLGIRPNCQHCNRALPNGSDQAMICSFECTYCKVCVDKVLENVCPSCSGGFEKRPTRPKAWLSKYPVSKVVVFEPIKENKYLEAFKLIDPRQR